MKFRWFRTCVIRAALFAVLWWVWLGHDAVSWIVGAPTVVACTVVSALLMPPLTLRVSFLYLLWFLPKMLWRALAGGYDVAGRLLGPELRIAPLMIRYPVGALNHGSALWWFLHSVSLLPGTLSAALEDDEAIIHILDNEDAARRDLDRLQSDILRLFRLA